MQSPTNAPITTSSAIPIILLQSATTTTTSNTGISTAKASIMMIQQFLNAPSRFWNTNNSNETLSTTLPPPPTSQPLESSSSSVSLIKDSWEWFLSLFNNNNNNHDIDSTTTSTQRITEATTKTTVVDGEDGGIWSYMYNYLRPSVSSSSVVTMVFAFFLAFGLHTVIRHTMIRLDNKNNNYHRSEKSKQSHVPNSDPAATTTEESKQQQQVTPPVRTSIDSYCCDDEDDEKDATTTWNDGIQHATAEAKRATFFKTINSSSKLQSIILYSIVNGISIAAKVYISLILIEYVLVTCIPFLNHTLQQFLWSDHTYSSSIANNNNNNMHVLESNNNSSTMNQTTSIHSNETIGSARNASFLNYYNNINSINHHHTVATIETTTGVLLAMTQSIVQSFRLREGAPIVSLIIFIGYTMIALKRYLLLDNPSSSNTTATTSTTGPVGSTLSPSSTTNMNTVTTQASSSSTTTTTTILLPSNKISGRMILYNRMIDIVIYGIMIIFIFHEITIDTTTTHTIVHMIVSAGGITALLCSFASKDIAIEMVGGFILGISDIYHIGDRVRIEPNIAAGKVIDIGYVETTIQSYDNIITRVPNSQLTKARISNLSRCTRSRLKQFIRIKYSDIERLSDLLSDIRNEIIVSCPKVISDGTKSFHTVISSYEVDHVQVMILAHFEIPPVTAEYIRNRHEVLLCIYRCMKRHNIDFAVPPVLVYNNNNNNNTTSPKNGGKDPADYSNY